MKLNREAPKSRPIHTLVFGLVFALAVVPWEVAPVRAQEPLVIAVLDMERILRDSKAAQTLRAEIDRQRAEHQKELREKEDALRTADEELARQRAVLSAEAFAAKRRELQEQATSLQREFLSRQKGMEQAFGKGIAQVRSALVDVATNIAEERGIDLILLKGAVVLVSRELDITEETMERLNEKLPSIDVSAMQN